MSIGRKLSNKLLGISSKIDRMQGDYGSVFGGSPPKPEKNIGKTLRNRTADNVSESGRDAKRNPLFDFDRDNDGKNDLDELNESTEEEYSFW